MIHLLKIQAHKKIEEFTHLISQNSSYTTLIPSYILEHHNRLLYIRFVYSWHHLLVKQNEILSESVHKQEDKLTQ